MYIYGIIIIVVVAIIILRAPSSKNSKVINKFKENKEKICGYKLSTQNCVDKYNYTAFITPGHHKNKLPKKLGPPHFGKSEYCPNMEVVKLIQGNAI